MIDKNKKLYVAGHRGMVGKAIENWDPDIENRDASR